MTEHKEQPVAWVIPGSDNARGDGSIDAMAWKDGEFTMPLYGRPAELLEALQGLVECWKEFQASSGNMEEAYYKLAKYAYPQWEKAIAAISKAEGTAE